MFAFMPRRRALALDTGYNKWLVVNQDLFAQEMGPIAAMAWILDNKVLSAAAIGPFIERGKFRPRRHDVSISVTLGRSIIRETAAAFFTRLIN